MVSMIAPSPKVKKTLSSILEKRNPDEEVIIKDNIKKFSLAGNYSVGLEFELENLSNNLNKNMIDFSLWEEHREGSLRGEATELVTRFPLKGDTLLTALYNIYDASKESMAPMKSLRTSTHIHINALDMSVEELCYLLLLAAIIEPYLFSISDPYRRYCGFCLPSEETITPIIATFLHNKTLGVRNYSRYYGINVQAISKYGTLEFRHFSTPDKIENAIDYVNVCLTLKKLAFELAESTEKMLTKTNLRKLLSILKNALEVTFKTKLTADVEVLEVSILTDLYRDESWKYVQESNIKHTTHSRLKATISTPNTPSLDTFITMPDTLLREQIVHTASPEEIIRARASAETRQAAREALARLQSQLTGTQF